MAADLNLSTVFEPPGPEQQAQERADDLVTPGSHR
jgi:hypothetical protein